MPLLFATSNKGKFEEARAFLAGDAVPDAMWAKSLCHMPGLSSIS